MRTISLNKKQSEASHLAKQEMRDQKLEYKDIEKLLRAAVTMCGGNIVQLELLDPATVIVVHTTGQ